MALASRKFEFITCEGPPAGMANLQHKEKATILSQSLKQSGITSDMILLTGQGASSGGPGAWHAEVSDVARRRDAALVTPSRSLWGCATRRPSSEGMSYFALSSNHFLRRYYIHMTINLIFALLYICAVF